MHDIFSQIFNQELKQLGSDLQSMAAQVATAIERASESLRNGDLIVAEQVIDADERINDLQRDIDDMCNFSAENKHLSAGKSTPAYIY